MQPNLIVDDDCIPVAKVLKSSIIEANDNSIRYRWTIKSTTNDLERLANSLAELSQHCQHAHDCCGRWYRTVHTYTLKHTKRYEYTVEVDMVQNV